MTRNEDEKRKRVTLYNDYVLLMSPERNDSFLSDDHHNSLTNVCRE